MPLDQIDQDGSEFLTVAEIALRMRVSRATVYRLVHDAVDALMRKSYRAE